MPRKGSIKLTEKMIEDIVKYRSQGLFQWVCAAKIDISTSTWDNYKNEAEELYEKYGDDPPAKLPKREKLLLGFLAAIKKGRAEFLSMHVLNIQRHAMKPDGGQWTASAWLLERIFNEQFGKPVNARLSGSDGGAIKHQIERIEDRIVPPEQMESEITAILERLNKRGEKQAKLSGGEKGTTKKATRKKTKAKAKPKRKRSRKPSGSKRAPASPATKG